MFLLDVLTLLAVLACLLLAVTGTGRMVLHAGVLVLRSAGRRDLRLKRVKKAHGARYHLLAIALGAVATAALVACAVLWGAPAATAATVTILSLSAASLVYYGLRP